MESHLVDQQKAQHDCEVEEKRYIKIVTCIFLFNSYKSQLNSEMSKVDGYFKTMKKVENYFDQSVWLG